MPKQKVKIAKRRDISRQMKRNGAVLGLPDFGAPERWQHATRKYEVMEKDSNRLVARVVEECALDALHMAGRISGGQRAAGLRLRHAYVRAKIEQPRIGRYDPQPRRQKGGGFVGFERSDSEEEAYAEWRAALDCVPPRSVDIIVSVCCIGDALPPAQLETLRGALADLLHHYRAVLGERYAVRR